MLNRYNKYTNQQLEQMRNSLQKKADKLIISRTRKWKQEIELHEEAHQLSYKLSGLNQRIYSMGLKIGMNISKGCPSFVCGKKDESGYIKGDQSIPFHCVMRGDKIWGKYFFQQCRDCKIRNDRDLEIKVTVKLLQAKDDPS